MIHMFCMPIERTHTLQQLQLNIERQRDFRMYLELYPIRLDTWYMFAQVNNSRVPPLLCVE